MRTSEPTHLRILRAMEGDSKYMIETLAEALGVSTTTIGSHLLAMSHVVPSGVNDRSMHAQYGGAPSSPWVERAGKIAVSGRGLWRRTRAGAHVARVGMPVEHELWLLEVKPSERQGRGRWWRPNGAGYTDDLAEAGLYSADDAERRERGGHTSARALAAREILYELGLVETRRTALRAMLARTGTKVMP